MTAQNMAQAASAMSGEPGSLEVIITVAAGNLFGGVYRDYVHGLGLRGHERVLDFGCGSGNPARYLAPLLMLGGGWLTCVDVSRTWLEVARQRLRKYPNVEFMLGDIADLDLPAQAYDVVFIHFVLHDITAADRPRVIRHLAGKLNHAGRVYVREPLRFISGEEVCGLMEQNGLRALQSQTVNVPTQGLTYEGVFG